MSEDEQEIYATLVEINQEPTELYKILKFENIVCGGGEAKRVISDGYVYLNGEVETRKRKKVYAGDLISFNGHYFQIALKGATAGYEFVEQEAADAAHSEPELPIAREGAQPTKIAEEKSNNKSEKIKKARKPISF